MVAWLGRGSRVAGRGLRVAGRGSRVVRGAAGGERPVSAGGYPTPRWKTHTRCRDRRGVGDWPRI